MLFGAHESVAGGLAKAFGRATVDHCRALQIFTKNSNSWREPALSDKDIDGFRRAHTEAGAPPVLAHTSYLINLASLKDETLTRSKGALVAELDRSTSLGIAFCVLHPGAHLGAGDDAGLAQIVASLDEVHARTPGATALTLLENTAGQGTCVGHRFEHLAELLSRVKQPERMGVCLDTQHAFAAGYDATTPEGYGRVFEEFDRVVGLKWLRAFHLNDSKKPLGSRVDRHEHLGEGSMGLGIFWQLANDPRFASHPAVLETEPREGPTPYLEELEGLVRLVGSDRPGFRLGR